MFEKARIRLTTWYLLIIMTISVSFSAFIFRSVGSEFQRRLNMIESRLSTKSPQGWRLVKPVHDFFQDDLNLARKQVFFILLNANGIIFVFSAAAGYYLAGKTLQPIESAMEDQKRFIADASHELKTPLTALQTSIEVALRDKKMNLRNAKKVLKQNLEDVRDLTNLSNNLLTLSNYQQNRSNLSKEKVDVEKLISKVIKKLEPLSKKKSVDIKFKSNPYNIKANKEGLEKVITILLDNAIKYSHKKGTVIVALSKSKSRRCLVLKVKDKGVGISKKDLPCIFDRFYRADSSRTKSKTEGFGLGLSMAKKIVKLHNGSIKAKSEVEKGSTFTVKLPLS